jgi:hypothetical protein
LFASLVSPQNPVRVDKQKPFEFWVPDSNAPAKNQLQAIQNIGKQAIEAIERPNPAAARPVPPVKKKASIKIVKDFSKANKMYAFKSSHFFLFP